MPLTIMLSAKDYEILCDIADSLKSLEIVVNAAAMIEKEEPKKDKAEEKPKTSRRSSKKAAPKKEDDISPLLMDTLKAAHQVTEEIEDGEALVKEIMKEEFDKENMSDLSGDQLKKLTEILKEELEMGPEGD